MSGGRLEIEIALLTERVRMNRHFEVMMSQKASGLADLMSELGDVDEFCGNLAEKFRDAFGELKVQAAITEGIVDNVVQGAAKLRAVNARFSNGDPTALASSALSRLQKAKDATEQIITPTAVGKLPEVPLDPASLRPRGRIDL
jgi:6,7-dimethyl-8-ribityllumazine synthase